MPDPIGYTVEYSFSGWQASNPTKPLPAAPLDNELALVEISIASILEALSDVRREDGAVANESVGLDQLTPDVRAALSGDDPRVLVSDLNPASFATQDQAEAGAANDKIMTPLRTKQAMDAQRAFASQGEAELGEEAAKVLSPLSGKQQLDALRAFANQAEAEAGVNAVKVMSPLTTKQQLDVLRKIVSADIELTWSAIAAGTTQTQTVTVTGAVAGDIALCGLPSAGVGVGLIPTVWTSADNQVSVRLYNATAGPLTPATLTWKFKVLRF
jgi:hypothetical protein